MRTVYTLKTLAPGAFSDQKKQNKKFEVPKLKKVVNDKRK